MMFIKLGVFFYILYVAAAQKENNDWGKWENLFEKFHLSFFANSIFARHGRLTFCHVDLELLLFYYLG